MHKLLLLTLPTVIIMASVLTSFAMRNTKEKLGESISNNMLNLALSYGKMIDIEKTEAEGALTTDKYREILSGISIQGYTTGYAYVVDKTGMMLYHPTSGKIGQPVSNSVVAELATNIGRGIIAPPASIRYVFNGTDKFAAYYISDIDHSILVVTLDQSDVDADIQSSTHNMLVRALAILVFAIVGSIVAGINITRPFKKLAEVAGRLAELDLRREDDNLWLENRTDECGDIARACADVRRAFVRIPVAMSDISSSLREKATHAQHLSAQVSDETAQSADLAEKLTGDMKDTARTTASIDSGAKSISSKSEQIAGMSSEGTKLAGEIMKRAENLKSTSRESIEKTQAMYSEVKEETAQAMEKSKAVEKIDKLTKSIKKIASRTSLLALNASIEAARAGEQGKGFAVVAGEIGDLANQSTQTVNSISEIVAEVQEAVTEMSSCMATTLDFLEQTVSQDYSHFGDVGEKYAEDALSFEHSMSTIHGEAAALSVEVNEIVDSINGITLTMNEATQSVVSISEKTIQTAKVTEEVRGVIVGTADDSVKLHTLVGEFKY